MICKHCKQPIEQEDGDENRWVEAGSIGLVFCTDQAETQDGIRHEPEDPGAAFLRAFEHGTQGLEAFSVGACPGCKQCNLDVDSASLSGATCERTGIGAASPIRCYDEGSGSLWVVVESLGPIGVVRADTFEDAWDIAQDCILADADPADPDCYARAYDESADSEDLAEGHHWRPNGAPTETGLSSPMCQEDLNGCLLIECKASDEHGAPVDEVQVHSWTIGLDWGDRETARDCADEGSFSWSSCDVCSSSLGGYRYPAHYLYTRPASAALPERRSVEHIEVCVDCLLFAANGDVPEAWR